MSILRKRGMTYSMSGLIAEGKVQAGSLQVGSEEPTTKIIKVAKKPLTGAALHAGVQAWQNPETVAIVIERVLLDRTTKSTGASTMDIGTTATSATTASDSLIDGVNSGAAEAIEDNLSDAGTNGKARQKLAAGKWVTFKEASGDATGLVANAYIHYHTV
jgi:hypothetical protein